MGLGMGLEIKLHVSNPVIVCFIPDLLTEGFSYHEKTPPISETMINPVSDRSLADALLTLLTSKLADESDTTGKADSSNQNCPSPPVSIKFFTCFAKRPLNFSPSELTIFSLMYEQGKPLIIL